MKVYLTRQERYFILYYITEEIDILSKLRIEVAHDTSSEPPYLSIEDIDREISILNKFKRKVQGLDNVIQEKEEES